MPVALTVDTVQTSGMPTTTAPSTTPLKARAPLVINANDRVKVYSMMHPGQRQHKAARLKVGRKGLASIMHQLAETREPLCHDLNVCWDLATQVKCIVHRGCVWMHE